MTTMRSSDLSDHVCDLSFPKSKRLLNAHDYSAVFNDAPFRASCQHALILSRPNSLTYSRVGIIVAKKNVRKACNRNVFKRITRESFRLKQHKIPAIDAIVLARKGVDNLTKGELAQVLDKLWIRVVKKANKQAAPITKV